MNNWRCSKLYVFYLKAFDVWSEYIWLVLTLLPAGLLPHKKMTTKGGHFAMQMPHPIPVTTSQTKDCDGQSSWGMVLENLEIYANLLMFAWSSGLGEFVAV